MFPIGSTREFYETPTGEIPSALPRLDSLHRSRRGARLRRIRQQPLSQSVSRSRPFPKGDLPEDRCCLPTVIPWRSKTDFGTIGVSMPELYAKMNGVQTFNR